MWSDILEVLQAVGWVALTYAMTAFIILTIAELLNCGGSLS